MFVFHRLLSLVTMMYNEQDELTVCDFIRQPDRSKIHAARVRRAEAEAAQEEHGGSSSGHVAIGSPVSLAPGGATASIGPRPARTVGAAAAHS
mmetsp:Transcript_18245/g.49553  ORF Transcript_18245/g.49553 Transcript_18245/m.49553 type:complete len:93 (+) Transcript_18245:113-391(+)